VTRRFRVRIPVTAPVWVQSLLGGTLLAGVVGIPTIGNAAPPVEVQSVTEAAVPTVKVVGKGSGTKLIPACRGVVWQRFDARTSDYTPISNQPCPAMAPALSLAADGQTFEVDAPVRDGDVVRAVVVVGTGCAAGKPFEMSDCATVVAVEGPTITVRGSKKR